MVYILFRNYYGVKILRMHRQQRFITVSYEIKITIPHKNFFLRRVLSILTDL